MEKIQIFLDTDVIVSALLSKTGASYIIINNPNINKNISISVKEELLEVGKRLNIQEKEINKLFRGLSISSLKLTKKELLKSYKKFVFDEQDSHVVAGADKTKSKFLLTHNLKHYQTNKIKAKLGIIVLKPGNFLQYLKSLNK